MTECCNLIWLEKSLHLSLCDQAHGHTKVATNSPNLASRPSFSLRNISVDSTAEGQERGRVVRPPRKAEYKAQQNEYFKCGRKKKLFCAQ